MKNGKTKTLSILLASALGAASFVGGLFTSSVFSADEPTPVTYTASEVFGTSSASLQTDGGDGGYVQMQFSDNGKVTFKQRDLALKWATANGAQYMSMTFDLDANFATFAIVLESSSAYATKDKKTTNTLTFTNTSGVFTAQVNDDENSKQTLADVNEIVVSLAHSDEYGAFTVLVDGLDCGEFVNVGDNFAEYASSSATTPLQPLAFKATLPQDATEKTVMTFRELNGQPFNLTEGKITDQAKPVICVNDDINTFSLGTKFSVDYEAVDVLDKSISVTETYYQYDPDDWKDAEMTKDKIEYKSLTSDVAFKYTTYDDNGTSKYVFDSTFNGKTGREFVSIKLTAPDDTFKGDNAIAYELAWFANQTETFNDIKYIVIDKNDNAPMYKYAGGVTKEDYQALVTENAKGLEAGSNTEFYLPSLVGYITDDEGYKNLKFTISYKSSANTSDSPTNNTGRSPSNLKFTVSQAATYEFKVFAEDKAGNKMVYLDDECVNKNCADANCTNEKHRKVEITTDNVWDIDAIPAFRFTVSAPSLKIEDPTSNSGRMDLVSKGGMYDDFSVDAVGDSAANAKTTSKLYRVDMLAFNETNPTYALESEDFYEITYEEIATEAKKRGIATEDVPEFFLDVYVSLLATKKGVTAQQIWDANVFVEVEEFNSAIDEELHPDAWDKSNKYNWSASSRSFTAAEEGTYFVLAVYEDKDVSTLKAAAYKVVTVSAANDKLPGESDWLKNNVVSVVLFSIAAVMLVLIIILLLIKPSDETLEDVDVAVKEKKNKKDKK